MATARERITVYVTRQEKREIAAKANKAGISMGELLRRAALSYEPAEDEEMLEGIIEQLRDTAEQTCASIDSVLALVEASSKRIDAMETTRTSN